MGRITRVKGINSGKMGVTERFCGVKLSCAKEQNIGRGKKSLFGVPHCREERQRNICDPARLYSDRLDLRGSFPKIFELGAKILELVRAGDLGLEFGVKRNARRNSYLYLPSFPDSSVIPQSFRRPRRPAAPPPPHLPHHRPLLPQTRAAPASTRAACWSGVEDQHPVLALRVLFDALVRLDLHQLAMATAGRKSNTASSSRG
jgi:hypothetical protein